MKRKRLIELINRSAYRLAEAEDWLEQTKSRAWLLFLKRESNILLKRAVALWIKTRLGRGK